MSFTNFVGKVPDASVIGSLKAEFLIADMDDNVNLTYDATTNKITACAIGAANKIFRLGYQENNQSKISFKSNSEIELHTGAKKVFNFSSMAELTCVQTYTNEEIQELLDTRLMLAVVDPAALQAVSTAALGSSDDISSSFVRYIIGDVGLRAEIDRNFGGEAQRWKFTFEKTDMESLIDAVGQNIAISIA